MKLPIDLSAYKPVALDPKASELTAAQKTQLEANIQLCRDAIVFFTALAGGARASAGHTGGAYDTVPEVHDHPRLHRTAARRSCRSSSTRPGTASRPSTC